MKCQDCGDLVAYWDSSNLCIECWCKTQSMICECCGWELTKDDVKPDPDDICGEITFVGLY